MTGLILFIMESIVLLEIAIYYVYQIFETPIEPAKATAILVAVELGQRACSLRPPDRAIIESPDAAVAVLSHELMWSTQERFAILLLDVKNRLLGTQLTRSLQPQKH